MEQDNSRNDEMFSNLHIYNDLWLVKHEILRVVTFHVLFFLPFWERKKEREKKKTSAQRKSWEERVARGERYPWSAAFNFPEITFLHYFLTLSPPRRFRWILRRALFTFLRLMLIKKHLFATSPFRKLILSFFVLLLLLFQLGNLIILNKKEERNNTNYISFLSGRKIEQIKQLLSE